MFITPHQSWVKTFLFADGIGLRCTKSNEKNWRASPKWHKEMAFVGSEKFLGDNLDCKKEVEI